MGKNSRVHPEWPVWYEGQSINESLFHRCFLQSHQMIYTENSFFTVDGRMVDEAPMRLEILHELESYAVQNVPKKISNIMELLKISTYVEDFPPQEDRIHVANGTLFLDGTFVEGKQEIVHSRFPVLYNPDAPQPVIWLSFLHQLLEDEDILTLQEFIPICLHREVI